MAENLDAAIVDLERQIKEVRARRLTIQRSAAQESSVRLALTPVQRDRSVSTSPKVDELIDRVQTLHDELASLWDDDERIRLMLEKVRKSGYSPDIGDLARLLERSAAERDAFLDAEAVGRS
ncbi:MULTISPECIES: hypothetical protein [unclassified Aeromicrobium]|jgi:hypothetical protein|uniref:hypothetical protein n=1 Tax=unclassified Aeromicrobium TaxID=2633570 RepID=UPI00257EB842|nr:MULTISPECIES: hypothetical protein [unclassified Aeromicrobium]